MYVIVSCLIQLFSRCTVTLSTQDTGSLKEGITISYQFSSFSLLSPLHPPLKRITVEEGAQKYAMNISEKSETRRRQQRLLLTGKVNYSEAGNRLSGTRTTTGPRSLKSNGTTQIRRRQATHCLLCTLMWVDLLVQWYLESGEGLITIQLSAI